MKEGSWFAVIDSHGHRIVHQQRQETSCVAYFSCVASLYTYIVDLAHSLGAVALRFEITGIEVARVCTNMHGMLYDESKSSTNVMSAQENICGSELHRKATKQDVSSYLRNILMYLKLGLGFDILALSKYGDL